LICNEIYGCRDAEVKNLSWLRKSKEDKKLPCILNLLEKQMKGDHVGYLFIDGRIIL
jgi:hypothetical protein